MKHLRYHIIYLFLILSINIHAQSTFVERSTDVLCLAPSATGLIKCIVDKDKKGLFQLGLSTVTGLAINYGINACIRKDRPEMPSDASWGDHHAFPSTHTMLSFDGATFLMRRYGWEWGVPAYVVSSYVAWGRVSTCNHDLLDVLAGAVVGAGASLIYTRPFVKDAELTIAPAYFVGEGNGLYLSLKF